MKKGRKELAGWAGGEEEKEVEGGKKVEKVERFTCAWCYRHTHTQHASACTSLHLQHTFLLSHVNCCEYTVS